MDVHSTESSLRILHPTVVSLSYKIKSNSWEAHLALKSSIQVNKIASSCEICSGPHDTQYCMENLEQAFVDNASSRTDEAGGALPSDTVKSPKLNVNSTAIVSSARSYPTKDPQSSSNPFNSVNAIKTCFKSTNDFQKDQPQIKILTVDEIETPKSKDEKALEDEFKDLHLNLPVLEVLAHARLADGTKMYPVGIVRNVEVYVGKLKLLEDFYVINMEKDRTCPLLVGRGFLATISAVIDCKKAKIAVGDGITRSIFGVKDIGLARDTKLNPFRDVLVFRKMMEFLGAMPNNFKRSMWESKDMVDKK
ncbi:MAK10-like protein [Tanacetum coccineum]